MGERGRRSDSRGNELSLRLGALHDALLHPGDVEMARKAAEEVADYHERIGRIERDLTVLKWMVGTNVALTLMVLGRIWWK
jgi:hypothetical protein